MYKCFKVYQINIKTPDAFSTENPYEVKKDSIFKYVVAGENSDKKAILLSEYYPHPLYKYICIEEKEYREKYNELKEQLRKKLGGTPSPAMINRLLVKEYSKTINSNKELENNYLEKTRR